MNEQDSLTIPTRKLVITSKIDSVGSVSYFVNPGGCISHPLKTSLAYALVRNNYARFLTTQKALDELFG